MARAELLHLNCYIKEAETGKQSRRIRQRENKGNLPDESTGYISERERQKAGLYGQHMHEEPVAVLFCDEYRVADPCAAARGLSPGDAPLDVFADASDGHFLPVLLFCARRNRA